MTYQTPQLTLVGSATGLVLGLPGSAGIWSDHKDVPLPLIPGNSRFTVRE